MITSKSKQSNKSDQLSTGLDWVKSREILKVTLFSGWVGPSVQLNLSDFHLINQ